MGHISAKFESASRDARLALTVFQFEWDVIGSVAHTCDAHT